MKPIQAIVSFAIAAVACAAVHAQQPASDAAIPANNCEKPGDGPGIQPSYEQQKRFQKKVDAYKDCINKYAAEMKKLSDEHFEIVKKYQDAGNAAINEYNTFATQLNAQANGQDNGSANGKPSAPQATPRSGGKY